MATTGDDVWLALAEYTDALSAMCRERRMRSMTELVYTAHTSAGPVPIPKRIADAELRWARAKTVLRDALRARANHDPGDEDRSER